METPAILTYSTNVDLPILHMVVYFAIVCIGVVAYTSLSWSIVSLSVILCIAFGLYNGFHVHHRRRLMQQTTVLCILLFLRLGTERYYHLKDGAQSHDNSSEVLKTLAEDIFALKFLPKAYMELYLGTRRANGGYAAAMARSSDGDRGVESATVGEQTAGE
jgi:ribose/xylose/arabinose/galactoside ABC-type transport system permease subunit